MVRATSRYQMPTRALHRPRRIRQPNDQPLPPALGLSHRAKSRPQVSRRMTGHSQHPASTLSPSHRNSHRNDMSGVVGLSK